MRQHLVQHRQGVPHPVRVVGKIALPRAPQLARLHHGIGPFGGSGREATPAQPLDRLEPRAVLLGHHGPAQAGPELTLDHRGQVMAGEKIHDRLRPHREHGGHPAAAAAGAQQDARHHRLRMVQYRHARRAASRLLNQAGGTQFRGVLGPHHEMVDPLVEIRPGLLPHAGGQPARKAVVAQEGLDPAAQQVLGLIGQRPVKLARGVLRRRRAGNHGDWGGPCCNVHVPSGFAGEV